MDYYEDEEHKPWLQIILLKITSMIFIVSLLAIFSVF